MAKAYLAAALALATASALQVSHVLVLATTARSMSLAGPGMARPQPEQRLLLAAERGQIAPQSASRVGGEQQSLFGLRARHAGPGQRHTPYGCG